MEQIYNFFKKEWKFISTLCAFFFLWLSFNADLRNIRTQNNSYFYDLCIERIENKIKEINLIVEKIGNNSKNYEGGVRLDEIKSEISNLEAKLSINQHDYSDELAKIQSTLDMIKYDLSDIKASTSIIKFD